MPVAEKISPWLTPGLTVIVVVAMLLALDRVQVSPDAAYRSPRVVGSAMETVEGLQRDVPAAPAFAFQDVSQRAGVAAFSGPTWGSAWGDFDGDGRVDIFVSNHGLYPSLYRNLGDGRFEDVALDLLPYHPGSDEPGGQTLERKKPHSWFLWDTHGGAWGDFDNDGDPDLILGPGRQYWQGRKALAPGE